MSNNTLESSEPFSLLRIGEAWRNRPGLTTLLITFVACALLLVLGAKSGSVGVGLLSVLLTLLLAYAGASAAGGQFMDQAAGRPITPVSVALIGSPLIVLRSLGLTLVIGVGFLALVLVATVLLYLSKVPGLGAILYAFVLPVLTFSFAIFIVVASVVGLIAGAALWEGHPLATALSQGWAVAVQRPSQAFLSLMLLLFAASVVNFMIAGFVFAGFGVNAGLSAAILGREIGGGFGGMMGSMMGGGGYGGPRMGGGAMAGGSSGLAVAALIGGALVVAVSGTLFAAIWLLGASLTYLKLTAGLDVTATEAAMGAAIAKTKEKAHQAAAEAKRRAQEAQAAASQRLEQAREAHAARSAAAEQSAAAAATAAAASAASATTAASATPATPAPPAAPEAAPSSCPACQTPITAQDAFCGSCGHKLR